MSTFTTLPFTNLLTGVDALKIQIIRLKGKHLHIMPNL